MTAQEFQILKDRLAQGLKPAGPDECWEWHRYRQPNGYGWVNTPFLKIAAHRLALILSGVSVPRGMDVCHRCDNRACVNPAHLYVGTRKQNMADCSARNRHNKPTGEKHWCAKLSADDVRTIRSLRESGATVTQIAEQYSINHGTVSRIARREWRQEVA